MAGEGIAELAHEVDAAPREYSMSESSSRTRAGLAGVRIGTQPDAGDCRRAAVLAQSCHGLSPS